MFRYLTRYNYSTISKATPASVTSTKATSVHIPTHREQKANPDHITQLADYDQHFALKDIPLTSGIMGVKLEVLLSMVDAFSENPTFTLDQKKDALKKAVRFMKGEKNEVKLESMSGTPQQKSRKKDAATNQVGPASNSAGASEQINGTEGNDDVILPKEVEDVMWDIENNWNFMTEESFNPVTLALELLDKQGGGRDIDKFLKVLEKLEKAMDIIVNDHYQAFNSSIETFGKVTDNISDSKQRALTLRNNLLKSKELLLCKRSDLLQFWIKSVQYKEMLRMLNTIEELKLAPEKFEALVHRKQYLSASKILLASIKTISSSDYGDIKALSDIRASLLQFRATVHETIIEELHKYVYLRASIFSSMLENLDYNTVRKSNSFIKTLLNFKKVTSSGNKNIGYSGLSSMKTTFLGISIEGNDMSDIDGGRIEDDPLRFIDMCLESLDLLGKIGDASNIIRQRLAYELYKITEKVIIEVEKELSEKGLLILLKKEEIKTNFTKTLSRVGLSSSVIEILLNRLFARYSGIMEIHQATISSLQRLSAKHDHNTSQAQQDERKKAKYTLSDLWTAMQDQLSTLLIQYLTDITRTVAVGEIKMDLKSNSKATKSGQTNKHKVSFRFADASAATNISSSVINFMSEGNAAGVVDSLSTASEVTGLKLIVKPTILNLPVIIKPTVEFVDDIETIYFPGKKGVPNDISLMLNSCLLKKFLPQLEDNVVQRFHESVNAIDSFRIQEIDDGINSISLMKCCALLVELLKDLCFAVCKVPIHQSEFIDLMETMMEKFVEKVAMRFNACCTETYFDEKGDECHNEIFSKSLINDGEFRKRLDQRLLNSGRKDSDANEVDDMSKALYQLELKALNGKPLKKTSLVSDKRNLEFLSQLRASLNWLIAQLEIIRRPGEYSDSKIDLRPFSEIIHEKDGVRDLDSFAETFGRPDAQIPDDLKRNALCLLLDQERSKKFDGIVKNLSTISDDCLHILKVEIRCHLIFNLDLAVKDGNYNSDDIEPDSHVMQLNQDIVNLQQIVDRTLVPAEQMYVFEGLAVLTAIILLSTAKHIRRMTKTGVLKMLKNIQSIQQSLSSISLQHEEKLDWARKYFQLFLAGGKEMVKKVENEGPQYSLEEYMNILRLLYQHELTIPDHPLITVHNECASALRTLCPK